MFRRTCAGLTLASLASAASAAVTIDNFQLANQVGFPTVIAEINGYPENPQLVASGTSTTGTIIGGSRDISVRIVERVAYAGDNSFASVAVQQGSHNGNVSAGLNIGLGAEGAYSIVYDGEGVGSEAAGLGLDLAAAGDRIRLNIYYAALLSANGTSPLVPLTFTLTDSTGRSAAVSRSVFTDARYLQTLDYDFAAFEAANANFDIRHVESIALTTQFRMESYLSGGIALSGIATFGDGYSPVNTPGAVPEPASWAIMLAGFGLIGGLMRRIGRSGPALA